MFATNDGDKLYNITTYELSRPDGILTIKVREALTEGVGQFSAIPCLNMEAAQEQYHGRGNSLEMALNDCLAKIKRVTIPGDLFPHAVS